MISREKCLEWVREAEEQCRHPYSFEDYTETLVNRAYAEGQKDMRERAAKVANDNYCTNKLLLDIRHMEIE